MRYDSNHTVAKLIAILLLILVFMESRIMVSAISVLLNASMLCVIVIGGLYLMIKAFSDRRM